MTARTMTMMTTMVQSIGVLPLVRQMDGDAPYLSGRTRARRISVDSGGSHRFAGSVVADACVAADAAPSSPAGARP